MHRCPAQRAGAGRCGPRRPLASIGVDPLRPASPRLRSPLASIRVDPLRPASPRLRSPPGQRRGHRAENAHLCIVTRIHIQLWLP
ncbi:hypothetical protein BST12_17830 [Mycobacterium angelicum]|uniref:Uncharacterized protein n=1 Tax=Mycobacterium angelicum TaxID=470074 RepID=A0A1W9ZMY3_MYCAN|nr:hypothetical protein BST12_17830 [Mycobacterium angelicum]